MLMWMLLDVGDVFSSSFERSFGEGMVSADCRSQVREVIVRVGAGGAKQPQAENAPTARL